MLLKTGAKTPPIGFLCHAPPKSRFSKTVTRNPSLASLRASNMVASEVPIRQILESERSLPESRIILMWHRLFVSRPLGPNSANLTPSNWRNLISTLGLLFYLISAACKGGECKCSRQEPEKTSFFSHFCLLSDLPLKLANRGSSGLSFLRANISSLAALGGYACPALRCIFGLLCPPACGQKEGHSVVAPDRHRNLVFESCGRAV